MISQKHKSFTTTSFNQRCYQKAIDSSLWFLTPNQFLEFPSVSSGLESQKTNAAVFQQFSDEFKMFQFFSNDFRHFMAEIFIFDIVEHEIHGR